MSERPFDRRDHLDAAFAAGAPPVVPRTHEAGWYREPDPLEDDDLDYRDGNYDPSEDVDEPPGWEDEPWPETVEEIAPQPSELAVTRLADVVARPVEWLWPGRLPRGKLVVFDGDPSVGKSTVTVDLAARITTGSPMPDGHRLDGPRSVVLLSAEDAADDTIRPRFDAAGGDPKRAVLFEGVNVTTEDGEPRMRPPVLPGDLDRLERIVLEEQAVLVVVDVLNAFLSGKVDGHRDQDVRSALMPLSRMAERCNCCVVVIRHLNKAGGANPLYRGGGSIGIIGAARVGLLVGADPDDETRRILAVSKSNLAAEPPALAYRLVTSDEHGCARIVWEGATAHRAGDLLSTRADSDDDQADATDVLASILDDGPMWVKEVFDAMAEAGFSKDQAKNAKKKLKVRSRKVGKPGDTDTGWKWTLPKGVEGSEGSGT
jgi:hypothetical protein